MPKKHAISRSHEAGENKLFVFNDLDLLLIILTTPKLIPRVGSKPFFILDHIFNWNKFRDIFKKIPSLKNVMSYRLNNVLVNGVLCGGYNLYFGSVCATHNAIDT